MSTQDFIQPSLKQYVPLPATLGGLRPARAERLQTEKDLPLIESPTKWKGQSPLDASRSFDANSSYAALGIPGQRAPRPAGVALVQIDMSEDEQDVPEGSDGDDEWDIDIPAVTSQDQWWDVQYAAEHKDALGHFDGWDFDADGELAGHGDVIFTPLRTEHALPRNDTRVEREERPDAVDIAGVAAKVIWFSAP
jgi:hypothetical protein